MSRWFERRFGSNPLLCACRRGVGGTQIRGREGSRNGFVLQTAVGRARCARLSSRRPGWPPPGRMERLHRYAACLGQRRRPNDEVERESSTHGASSSRPATSPWWVADNGSRQVDAVQRAPARSSVSPSRWAMLRPAGLQRDYRLRAQGWGYGPGPVSVRQRGGPDQRLEPLAWDDSRGRGRRHRPRERSSRVSRSPRRRGPRLYATDFHNRRVDVFDGNWQPVKRPVPVLRPDHPARLRPVRDPGDRLASSSPTRRRSRVATTRSTARLRLRRCLRRDDRPARRQSRVPRPAERTVGDRAGAGELRRFSGDLLVGNFGDGRSTPTSRSSAGSSTSRRAAPRRAGAPLSSTASGRSSSATAPPPARPHPLLHRRPERRERRPVRDDHPADRTSIRGRRGARRAAPSSSHATDNRFLQRHPVGKLTRGTDAPIVGTRRVVAATGKIARALGIALDLAELESEEAATPSGERSGPPRRVAVRPAKSSLPRHRLHRRLDPWQSAEGGTAFSVPRNTIRPYANARARIRFTHRS